MWAGLGLEIVMDETPAEWGESALSGCSLGCDSLVGSLWEAFGLGDDAGFMFGLDKDWEPITRISLGSVSGGIH